VQPADDVVPPAEPGRAARVVLFVRAGCHLCDEARVVVRAACDAAGEHWVEVDVDAAGLRPTGPVPVEYDELVPVVEVDGVRRGYWRIDPARLAGALAAGGGAGA